MMTEPQRTCPSCGNELSEATEFCPVCMLRKALADGVESGESSASEDTAKPRPEDAAQRFEHYELTVGPGERRILRLPAISQPDGHGNLETVAVIWTPALIKDENGHSRFEVH